MFFFSLRRTFLAARALGGIQYSCVSWSEWSRWPRSRGSLGLLLAGNRALRALVGPGVGLGALPPDRKALSVAATLVAADLDLATDVCLDLTTEVTLDLELLRVDGVAELDQLFVAQLVDPEVRVDAGAREE